ncbi:hypothetical protein [Mesorhizobium sp. CN2-181]|uniref:hypothetical protein n=1 Tax=Mesorhizobium yinganensis TaxID=3157707 RepID=UPI0032B730DE
MALKLSPSISEETVEHFAERDRQTGQIADPIVVALAGAVKAAREEGTALVNFEKAAYADRTLTPEASVLHVAQQALKTGERVAKQVDSALQRAKAEVASVERRIAAPPAPKDLAGLHVAGEIRAALARMPEKERDDAIANAFVTQNLSVIAAVLNGPAFLSGIGEAKLGLIRARYQREQFPADVKRIETLGKAISAAERAGSLFFAFIKEAADSPSAQLAAAGVRQREEAAAALQAGSGA